MNTKQTLKPKPGNQFWGIYYMDREFARETCNPIRTIVEAPTEQAAEQAAARLGFSDPWAHPITAEQVKQYRELTATRARGIHV
jgi:hypothetical protein